MSSDDNGYTIKFKLGRKEKESNRLTNAYIANGENAFAYVFIITGNQVSEP